MRLPNSVGDGSIRYCSGMPNVIVLVKRNRTLSGLGIALNEKGYALFMRLLRDFKEAIGFEHSIAILEMVIFNLVRQQVRSSP